MSVPPTLCVRLDGPLAAFGGPSKYRQHFTEPDPNLSFIQGMLAAAAGVAATDPLPDHLAALDPVLRQERAGVPLIDYQTVNQPDPANYRFLDTNDQKLNRVLGTPAGARATSNTVETERHYLSDVTYLLFLDDPDRTLERTLHQPVYSPYLGRRSCPPTEPLLLGRSNHSPWGAATTVPTVTYANEAASQTRSRTIITFTEPGDTTFRTLSRYDRMTRTRSHERQRRYYQQHHAAVAPLTQRQPPWEPIANALTALPDLP